MCQILDTETETEAQEYNHLTNTSIPPIAELGFVCKYWTWLFTYKLGPRDIWCEVTQNAGVLDLGGSGSGSKDSYQDGWWWVAPQLEETPVTQEGLSEGVQKNSLGGAPWTPMCQRSQECPQGWSEPSAEHDGIPSPLATRPKATHLQGLRPHQQHLRDWETLGVTMALSLSRKYYFRNVSGNYFGWNEFTFKTLSAEKKKK